MTVEQLDTNELRKLAVRGAAELDGATAQELLRWTDDDVQRYIDEHSVLVNPLVYEGYPSVGCAPCTAKVEGGADPRSGRWQGLSKTECGLHST